MDWFSDNELLIQTALAVSLLAYSFQVAMRSGVFSLAGVGFWAIGGYTTAYLVDHGWQTAPGDRRGARRLVRDRRRSSRWCSAACGRCTWAWPRWRSCC